MTDLLRPDRNQPPESELPPETEEELLEEEYPEEGEEYLPDEAYSEDEPEEYPESFSQEGPPPSGPGGPIKRKKKRKIGKFIAIGVAVAAIGGLIWFLKGLGAEKEDEGQALLDTVMRGSISSQVTGDGVTVPKNSATLTITSAGTVQEVYVSEGAQVTEGDPLFRMDTTTAQKAVNDAQRTVTNSQKELNSLQKAQADLIIKAPFKGKLIDCVELQKDQSVAAGEKLATLVDDTKMKLSLYFSYAYENAIYKGQPASISVPSATAQVTGQVEEIHKVRRVASEGTVLFEVVFVVKNPGALSADMLATASLTSSSGETVYPYESGKLAYYNSADITAKVGGPMERSNLMNYADVSAGAVLVQLGADDNSTAIAAAENQLQTAQEELKRAQEELEKAAPKAPISGTVLSVGITAGEEATSGTVAVSIADTSVMVVNAKIDDRNISFVKQGMMVDIDMWGTPLTGVVESVSLNGTYENGVSTFPAVFLVDNADGALMSGTTVTYTLAASQSDDCLMVPIQSVKSVETQDGSISVVYVQRDSPPADMPEVFSEIPGVPAGFYPVVVETGISDNANVEIVSGDLEEGETVFTQVMKSDSMGMMYG